eukprot:12890669-Prorocentrum_lima.AAC.1
MLFDETPLPGKGTTEMKILGAALRQAGSEEDAPVDLLGSGEARANAESAVVSMPSKLQLAMEAGLLVP